MLLLTELGHTAKNCKEERRIVMDRVEVKCVNCEEVGHRARDCPKARTDRFACRNCKYVDHITHFLGPQGQRQS